MRVLLTGGAGYIGSHVAVELINNGHEVVILDNFSNSKSSAIEGIKKISSSEFPVINGDVRDRNLLEQVLDFYKIDSVMHFAGKKAVSESISYPNDYIDNNVNGTLNLLRAMKKTGVNRLIFSSSATVYGDPQYLPLNELHPLFAKSIYGASKLIAEEIISSIYKSDTSWSFSVLRYFNPIGAHESGMIGDDPVSIPHNLLPFIAQVAAGMRDCLNVFGGNYQTKDGTCVRDYIHVVDLARAHVKALNRQLRKKNPEYLIVNLGTGHGYSVLDVIHAFENASNKEIPYVIRSRRTGDVATCFSQSKKAQDFLNWRAEFNIEKMCADAWHWQSKNPKNV